MIAMMRFSFMYYLRSYRYVAPLLILACAIMFIYNIVPNPIMSSFSLTATLLFMIVAWLGFGYVDLEDETQQVITVTHIRRVEKYYISKILLMVMISVVLSIMAIVYPIVFDKFDRQPTLTEGFIGVLSHILLSLLGLSISFLFTSKLISKLSYAIILLFLVICTSLAGAGIIESLPTSVVVLGWIIPPVHTLIEVLNNYETSTPFEIFTSLIAPLIYSSLLLSGFVYVMKRKLF